MRTTLDIDDDVLALARAEMEPVSIGRVLSELARTVLQLLVSVNYASDVRSIC